MKIRELMTRPIASCLESTSLSEAAGLMRERDVGFLLVAASSDDDHVVGVVSDRDALLAAIRQDEPLSHLTVAQAMSRDVHACHADDDVSMLHKTMRQHKIRRLPVLDRNQRAEGVVSLNDLAIRAGTAEEKEELSRTLAAICAHPTLAEIRGSD